MECPHCGAENTASASFCALCLTRFGQPIASADVVDAREAWVEPEVDTAAAFRGELLEQAEMWRRRREQMAEEREGRVVEEVAPQRAATFDELAERAAVEVSVSDALARAVMLRSVAWAAGIFLLACVSTTVLAYRFDWTALTGAAPASAAELKQVAVRSVSPAFMLWIDMTMLLFFGAAIASFVGALKTGEFRAGVLPVVGVAVLECLVLIPWLLAVPSKTPVTSMFGFGVIMSVGFAVVGALAGASVGRIVGSRS
jgi:hypothetical protein